MKTKTLKTFFICGNPPKLKREKRKTKRKQKKERIKTKKNTEYQHNNTYIITK